MWTWGFGGITLVLLTFSAGLLTFGVRGQVPRLLKVLCWTALAILVVLVILVRARYPSKLITAALVHIVEALGPRPPGSPQQSVDNQVLLSCSPCGRPFFSILLDFPKPRYSQHYGNCGDPAGILAFRLVLSYRNCASFGLVDSQPAFKTCFLLVNRRSTEPMDCRRKL